MVEFAILLPLLLLMLYGITEIGRALYQQNTLYKGLVAGSRYLGRANNIITIDLDTKTCTKNEPSYSVMEGRAKSIIASTVTTFPHFSTDNVVITVPTDAIEVGDVVGCKIQIIANVLFEPVFVPIAFGDDIMGPFTIHAEIEERYIGL